MSRPLSRIWMRSFVYMLAFCTFAAGCGDAALVARSQALGEPVGDYPSYSERLIHYFTNRARTAPTDFNPDDPYPPSPPLQFDYDLTVAARFHAQHILDANCWCEDHSSCCELSGSGEDVSCSGEVTGCGAMSAEARVSLFSPSYGGENMAMGQQSAAQAIDGWTNSAGHWENMNRPSFTKLGPGNFDSAWVQDFGTGGGPTTLIPDGIHFADGAATRFGTTYYQPNTGGPRTALVIVDGECHDLEVAHGTPEHGAFETAVSLGPGCHRYYFHFTDGNGNDVTYPSFGSFGVGMNADCEFFIDTRPADTCSPSGQTCETGDTRHCYTGPFGTEDVGVCEAGAERCIAGQWDGECRLEVGPSDEVCENDLDDDCDGEVDEDCSSSEDGASPRDPDGSEDGEMSDVPPTKSEDAGGCSTAGNSTPGNLLLMFLALMFGRRLRD